MNNKELCKIEELSESLIIWNVPPFVWTCSHYFTLLILARYLENFIGDHTKKNNPFHWHHVQFSLPCNTGYDPIIHRVWILLIMES